MDKDQIEEFKTKVGAKVKKLREAKGMTIAALGTKAEVTPPNISHIENGRQLGNLLTYYKLATALDAKIDDLLPDPNDDQLIG